MEVAFSYDQIFEGRQFCRYVGVIATFETLELFPKKLQKSKNASLVISLQYLIFLVAQFLSDTLEISVFLTVTVSPIISQVFGMSQVLQMN